MIKPDSYHRKTAYQYTPDEVNARVLMRATLTSGEKITRTVDRVDYTGNGVYWYDQDTNEYGEIPFSTITSLNLFPALDGAI